MPTLHIYLRRKSPTKRKICDTFLLLCTIHHFRKSTSHRQLQLSSISHSTLVSHCDRQHLPTPPLHTILLSAFLCNFGCYCTCFCNAASFSLPWNQIFISSVKLHWKLLGRNTEFSLLPHITLLLLNSVFQFLPIIFARYCSFTLLLIPFY